MSLPWIESISFLLNSYPCPLLLRLFLFVFGGGGGLLFLLFVLRVGFSFCGILKVGRGNVCLLIVVCVGFF